MPKTTDLVAKSLSNRPTILLILLLVLICVSYSNSLLSPPILDDSHSFIENSQLHPENFSFASIKSIASTSFGIARFVPLLTFALNNTLTPGNLPCYHLTNILIHLLAVTALFFFLQGLLTRTPLKDRRFALPNNLIILGVCGLWALSPVQTNAVTYLVQRMTSIMALFYLLAMAFYLYGRTEKSGGRQIIYLILGAICAALAFISKENSATLPLAVLLLEVTIINPGCASRLLGALKPRHWLLIGLVLLIVLPIPLKILADMANNYGRRSFTCSERLLTESRVVIWYMSLLALPLPARMNLDHDPLISRSLFSPPTTLLSIILLCVIIASTFRYRHKSSLLTFGVFFFFLNLIIESTFVPLELVFEHRLYLPSVGFFLAIAGILELILLKFQDNFGKLRDYRPFWLSLVILLAISSILTTLRNYDWRDKLSIYSDTLTKSPEKPRTYANLGLALGMEGRCKEAIPLLEKSISMGTSFDEEYLSSANNLINCLQSTASPEQATIRAEELLKNIPSNANLVALPALLYNLGNNYQASGKYKLALASFQEALRTEEQANNGYLLIAISSLINDVYKTNSDATVIGLTGITDKATATSISLAEILLDIKNYELAEQLLAKVDISSMAPNQARLVALKKRLLEEQKNNRLVAEATDISRDKFIQDSGINLATMKFSRLIIEHYPPLYFLAERMLERLKTKSPTDPFVEWYIIKLRLARRYPAIDLDSSKQVIAANPCFAPLLETEITQLLTLNKDKEALASTERLLQVYPGTPNWQYWLDKARRLSNGSSIGAGYGNS